MPDVQSLVGKLLNRTELAVPQTIVLAGSRECFAPLSSEKVNNREAPSNTCRNTAHITEAKERV